MGERRFLGPSVAFAILLILGAGIFLKIRGSANPDGEGGDSGGILPEVSATETFRTDVAVPVAGAAVVLDTLVISVTAAVGSCRWTRLIWLFRCSMRVPNWQVPKQIFRS